MDSPHLEVSNGNSTTTNSLLGVEVGRKQIFASFSLIHIHLSDVVLIKMFLTYRMPIMTICSLALLIGQAYR